MKRAFPQFAVWSGIPALAFIWLLAARLVWEQTFLTWDQGEQMVGFALAHSALVYLVFAALASLAWPIVVLVAVLLAGGFGGRKIPLMLAAYVLAWVLLFLPYGFWQRAFIWKFTPTQSVKLLSSAAARGDIRTVNAFLDRGIDINGQSSEGTALHAAVVGGQLDVIELLIARGADVNAINVYGDSPLAEAMDARPGGFEARAILASHGGILIQGTMEQRERARSERIRRYSQESKKTPPK